MKKYKKIIIVALCFALLLSMFSVSAFAADETVDQTASDSVAALSGSVWYVESGWSCTSNLAAYSLEYSIACASVADACTFIRLGSIVDSEGEIGYSDDSIVFELSSSDYITLNSSDDFVITFGEISSTDDLTPLYDFLSAYGELLLTPDYISDFYYQTYTIPTGWSVPAGYVPYTIYNYAFFDDIISMYSLGFSGNLIDEVESLDIITLAVEGDSELITLTPVDSFTISFDLRSLGNFDSEAFHFFLKLSSPLAYFVKHYGEAVIPPIPVAPALSNDLFSVFSSIGQWISGAVSSLVPMFWDGSSLTFVGILSVSALALSVVFLVFSLIEKFLRFGG